MAQGISDPLGPNHRFFWSKHIVSRISRLDGLRAQEATRELVQEVQFLRDEYGDQLSWTAAICQDITDLLRWSVARAFQTAVLLLELLETQLTPDFSRFQRPLRAVA